MKPRRWIAVADSHGDMIDPESRNAVMAFIADFKPEIRFHLGDFLDLRNLRNGASLKERTDSNKKDIADGSDFLREFFSGGKDNRLLLGNHDARMWEAAEATEGVTRDYGEEKVKQLLELFKRCRANWLPYDSRLGIHKLGHLKLIHGYAAGKNAARVHAGVYRNCLYGHTHRIESAPVESDEGPQEARGIGCLCKIDMPYNSRQLNKLSHSNGWAYGLTFPDGTYQLFQTRKIDGKFYCCHKTQAY